MDFFYRLMVFDHPIVIYLFLFSSAFIEYIFPPYPSDTIVLFGSFLAGKRLLDPLWLFISTALGNLSGSLVLFYLGITRGRDFFMERDFQFFPRAKIQKLEVWFAKHGGKIIIVNRFFSGFRSLFFIAAGIGKMAFPKVLIYSIMSIIIWNGMIIALGYRVGSEWQNLQIILKHYSQIVVTIFAFAMIFVVLRVFLRKNKKEKS